MSQTFTLTGGARIGRANATFPFARLQADKNVLQINASIIGNLVFQAKDIISIEPYSASLTGRGIRINHRVETYNPTVIFWTFKDPAYVIREIRNTGFLDPANSENDFADPDIIQRQQQGGFPVKKPVAIIFGVLWNVLFLTDLIPFFLGNKKSGIPFGNGVLTALGLLFLTSVMTIMSARFRTVILKEGRTFDDVKSFAYFMMLLSGLMFLMFTVIKFSHAGVRVV